MEYENNKPNIEKKVKINSDANVFDFKNHNLPLIRKKTYEKQKSIKSTNYNDYEQEEKRINSNSKNSINKSKSITDKKYAILPKQIKHNKKQSNLSHYSENHFKFRKKEKNDNISINKNSIKFITLPIFQSPPQKKSSIKQDYKKFQKKNTMNPKIKKKNNNISDLSISIENNTDEINSLSDIQLDNLYSQINVNSDSYNNSEEFENESYESSSDEENSEELNNIIIPKEVKNGQNIYIVNQKRNLSLKDTIKKVSLLQKTITNYKNQATKNKKNSIALMVDENTNINNKDKYKKTFKRKLTHSPKKKRKTQKKRTSQINEIFIVSENFIRKNRRESTQIIRPQTNILLYLNKEREAIKKSIDYIFPINEESLNNKKLTFLQNKVFPLIKQKTIPDKKKIEEITHQESMKKLVSQIFTNFYQKIIIKNTLKELEISMVEKLISFNPIKSININKFYICNRFFDIYDSVLYYIFDAKLKEKQFSFHRKSELFNNNLKILEGKIVISPRLKKTNTFNYKLGKNDIHFINNLIFKDFLNIMSIEEEIKIDFEAYPFLKRKRITKRKKRISLQEICKINKRKTLDLKINKVNEKQEQEEKKKEEIKRIYLIEKFNETSKTIDNWNPLKSYEIFHKPHQNKENEKLKQELIRMKKKMIFESKWRKDMSILKNLGGETISKHCALLKTQEYEAIYANSKSLEKLLQLIDRHQNKLFFENFRNFRINDIDQHEKYTGDTLLIRAAKCYNKPIITYLLDKGANINMQNYQLNTALHYAFLYSRYDLINLLVSNGADEKLVNKKGLTPWECLKHE